MKTTLQYWVFQLYKYLVELWESLVKPICLQEDACSCPASLLKSYSGCLLHKCKFYFLQAQHSKTCVTNCHGRNHEDHTWNGAMVSLQEEECMSRRPMLQTCNLPQDRRIFTPELANGHNNLWQLCTCIWSFSCSSLQICLDKILLI